MWYLVVCLGLSSKQKFFWLAISSESLKVRLLWYDYIGCCIVTNWMLLLFSGLSRMIWSSWRERWLPPRRKRGSSQSATRVSLPSWRESRKIAGDCDCRCSTRMCSMPTRWGRETERVDDSRTGWDRWGGRERGSYCLSRVLLTLLYQLVLDRSQERKLGISLLNGLHQTEAGRRVTSDKWVTTNQCNAVLMSLHKQVDKLSLLLCDGEIVNQ